MLRLPKTVPSEAARSGVMTKVSPTNSPPSTTKPPAETSMMSTVSEKKGTSGAGGGGGMRGAPQSVSV